MKKIVFGAFLAFFIIGCADKNKEISNQTALTWHRMIFKDLMNNNLDDADDAFTSLEVEHPESKFISDDLVILSIAHNKNKEFDLATFYMNQFKKRYASFEEKEWADYMICKYKFYANQNPYTNQKGIDDAIKFVNSTLETYPNSIFNYELNTMKLKLILSKKLFRQKIAKLYTKLDKPKSAKIYHTDLNTTNIKQPQIPWYKQLFFW